MDVGIDNDQGEQGCKRQRLRLHTPFGGGFYFNYLFDLTRKK
ncbi:hypothetical protein N643_07850 [Salmonella bongori serovar 48:z41:-- str. RKS3044]|nr:hypothetical protein N643_07850 [Salmonella bongori serovar 48:z41:-- str. RKS3044]